MYGFVTAIIFITTLFEKVLRGMRTLIVLILIVIFCYIILAVLNN